MPAVDPHAAQAPANVLAERDLLGLLKHAESLAVTTSKIELQRLEIRDGRGTELWFDPVTRSIIKGEDIKDAFLAPEPCRNYEAGTFESLVGMTLGLREDNLTTLVLARLDGIEVIFDEAGDRRDRIVFPLKVSETWHRLKKHYTIEQAALRRLLRADLDATYLPGNLVDIISKVKFNNISYGEATVETGKYALSKSLAAEITGTESLPEQFTAKCALWDNVTADDSTYIASPTIYLDADPATQKFTMRPVAGSIEACEAEALEWLVNQLRDALASGSSDKLRVYAGSTRPVGHN